jgi:ribonuclease D
MAHANAAAALPIPKHPLICQGKPVLIESDSALVELIAHLRDERAFAYDSEFIGELTYIPKLCVIQVATSRRIGLIDPLADLNLAPFWQLLADDSVEKIVHAGQQDIEPVWRHTGEPGRHFFDTQIAAGFLGLAYPLSLSRLVEEFLHVKLPKGLTFTHWDQRPLSSVQLRYAADDVRYLPAVHAELSSQLNKTGHMGWARQEFDSLCASSMRRFDPESQYLRIRGTSSLPPKNMAVLRELTIWRDQASQECDQPPRSFLRDEVLAELARSPVKETEKLTTIKGLPRPVISEYGQTIVDLTARALALPPKLQPHPPSVEETPRGRFNADALWATFQCLCSGRGIDPALVASHQEITHFHRCPDDSPLMQGWRRQAFGQPLLNLMRGKDALRLSWTQGRLQAMIDDYIQREEAKP